jgi:hypothetical protein
MDTLETVNIDQTTTEGDQSTELNQSTDGDAGATDGAGQEQSQVPQFDPQQWGYKYKGQMIFPKDRNHLITLAQQGHMAAQRMAELNKLRTDLDAQGKQYEPLKQLDEVFKKNPKFAQKIWDLYQRAQSGEDVLNGGGGEKEDPVYGQLTQEVQSVKSDLQKIKEEKEDQALEREIDTLKKNHADHEWGTDEGDGTLEFRIMKHAHDNGFNSLESAYRDLMWDTVRTNTEASTLQKAKENRVAEKKAGVIDKGGTGQRPAQKSGINIRDVSYNQIAEAAIKGL